MLNQLIFIKKVLSRHNALIKYLSVGVANTFVCLFTMMVLSHLGVHYFFYTIAGYTTAILFSFFMNLKFTFQQTTYTHHQVFLFFLLNGLNLFAVEAIEYTLIELCLTAQYIAILVGMMWYTATGYFMNRHFVYKASYA